MLRIMRSNVIETFKFPTGYDEGIFRFSHVAGH